MTPLQRLKRHALLRHGKGLDIVEFEFVKSLDAASDGKLNVYDAAWLSALNDHYILHKRTSKPRKPYKK